MKSKKAKFTTKWITYTAVLCALVIATGFIPPVPIPPFGNLYWCDGMIFLTAYLMDPLSAFIAGGIGTFLYDVIHGNSAMMFASLIIHGLQAAAVSAVLHYAFALLPKKLEPLWAGIASVAGAAIVVAGYFINRYFIAGYTAVAAGYRAVANVFQEIIGIAVGITVCYATSFKAQLAKNNLLPDFKKEVLGKEQAEQKTE